MEEGKPSGIRRRESATPTFVGVQENGILGFPAFAGNDKNVVSVGQGIY